MNRAFSLLMVLALTFAPQIALAAPSISLSIASVQSDANTTVTHTISGITQGETVTIERIADLNNNGQIDFGEPSLRTFVVQDGVRPTIGGVVNGNVPGDDDATANSSIRIDLPFPGVDVFMNRQPGKYIIRVTCASGQATTPFEITAPNYPQRLTGVLKNSSDNSTISFGIIVVLVGDGDPIGSIRTDSTGTFNFVAPAGDYVFVPVADGFISSLQFVSIPANQTVTQNLTLTPASVRVSGKLTDATTGSALPSVFVIGQAGNNQSQLISGALTDSNGNYSFSVTPGSWEINPLEDFTSELGYVSPDQGVTITAAATPITQNLTATKATSLIYGRVTNPSSAPIAGLSMRANQNFPQNLKAQGRTTAAGDYFLAVTTDAWQVQTRGASLFGFSEESRDLTITSGTATRADIQLRSITAHIRGRVVDARGNGLSGVRIQGQIGNNYNAAQADTAGDGSFDLGVWGGNWMIHIGNSQDFGIIEHFVNLTVVDGVDQTLTYVVPDPTGHIVGVVKDPSGQPMPNLDLSIESTLNGITYRSSAQTDASGNYSLPAFNGVWTFSFNCQSLDAFNYNCPGGQQVTVNNNTVTQNFNLTVHTTTAPQISAPTLNQSGQIPIFRFTLLGDPGAYDIFGAVDLNSPWNQIMTTTIGFGGNSSTPEFNPGAYHFFKVQSRP